MTTTKDDNQAVLIAERWRTWMERGDRRDRAEAGRTKIVATVALLVVSVTAAWALIRPESMHAVLQKLTPANLATESRRNPLEAENQRLRNENERLQDELSNAGSTHSPIRRHN
ncbi:MAG: hypothetical protein HY820_07230 [Acidobacteria bacterium]|nr:hypothetical protein [Acidobacteriota bacterium]